MVLVVGVVPLRRWLLLHADRDGDERRQAPHAGSMRHGGRSHALDFLPEQANVRGVLYYYFGQLPHPADPILRMKLV